MRSTVLPGTTHGTVIPTLERCSGKTYGEGFGVSVNPEFLREGVALHDVRHPPVTVVGHNHAADATGTMALYQGLDAPLVSTSIRVAEMVKYTSNAWHALKICFANEIGNVCKAVGVDSHDVMDIFCQDDKLNISKAYMKPGFAFGGSCLPKDVRALEYRAKELDLDLPLIQAVLPSNRRQIQHALDRIVESGCRTIGMLGLSFKAGTDDLRESPLVILAEALLGKGYALRIYDRNITIGRLIGANRAYIEEQIPHLARLMCDSADEVVDALRAARPRQRVARLHRRADPDPRRSDHRRPGPHLRHPRRRQSRLPGPLLVARPDRARELTPDPSPISVSALHLGCGKFFVRALEVVDAVAVEVPDARADFLHQILVVRDEEHGALVTSAARCSAR